MLILTKQAMQQSCNMAQAIEACRDALASYSQGQADIPLRSNVTVAKHEGQMLCMSGYAQGSESALGVKIVSVYPNNIQKNLPSVSASMIVLDAKTGVVDAILDGTYLTQLRTGAVQGLATDLLARQDANIAAVIGTGGQAMMQVAALLQVRPLTQVRVFDIDQTRCQQFVEQARLQFAGQYDAEFIACDSPETATDNADIVTTVTTASKPTFNPTALKSGVHINGVGAYTPTMCEIPHACMVQADCIICDTKAGVMAEAGDIIQPLNQGLIDEIAITGELGELINGGIEGRQHAQQMTIFKSVGSAVLDIVTAQRIVTQARALGLGTEVSL